MALSSVAYLVSFIAFAGLVVTLYSAATQMQRTGYAAPSEWHAISLIVCILVCLGGLVYGSEQGRIEGGQVSFILSEREQATEIQRQRTSCGSSRIDIYLNCLEQHYPGHPDLNNDVLTFEGE